MIVPSDVVRVRVHPSVTVIPEKAFYQQRKLEEVELCEGLLEIGSNAFGGSLSTGLWSTSTVGCVFKRIRIPSSVKVIGSNAFYCCKKLETVELCVGLLEIGKHAFSQCQSLKKIQIPSSVTIIHNNALSSCSKLEKVELHEGLLEIRNGAFHYCEALKRIRIPSTVTIINDRTFEGCKKLKDVEMCEGLLEIGSHAFSWCFDLKSINIPSTVTSIHSWAFAECGLEDIKLSEGLLEIGNMAFFCSSLKQIKIPSTVRVITKAFKECEKLEKVELSEGLVEIGEHAFYGCHWLESISIPSTVKIIGGWAFAHVSLTSLLLPDGITSIGDHAFWSWTGTFDTARIPPLITTITGSMCRCRGMFSMELPESIRRIDNGAFDSSTMLRNISLPPDAEIGLDAFEDCIDLKQLGSERKIIKALKHRFDNLPVHMMLYYQSYGGGRVLRSSNQMLRSKFDDPSIKQQDCLGMTTLHILACSTIQNIELYRSLIEKYPESLITEDKWGALPILYALWGDADSDIIQLLVQSYQSIFPSYELNWTTMMETLVRANVNVRKKVFERISRSLRKDLNQNQRIGWNALVEIAITHSVWDNHSYINCQTFRYLVVRNGVRKRVMAMRNCTKLFKEMVDATHGKTHGIDITDGIQGRRDFVKHVHNKLEVCEGKYNRMMEALTMIELELWKMKMNDCCGQQKTRRSKKMRLDDSAMRKQCRIKCGAEANIVIEQVLPYLDIL